MRDSTSTSAAKRSLGKSIREYALELLLAYESGEKYANLSLASLPDSFSQRERGLITSLFYTVVEHKLTYDYRISVLAKRSTDEFSLRTLNILRLGLCQICDISSIPDFAAVNETVALTKNKGERALVNAILRECVRRKDSLPLPPSDKNFARYLSVKYSFPTELVRRFVSLYGKEDAEKLLLYYNSEKYTDITINVNKCSQADYLKLLSDAGIKAEADADTGMSIRIPHSVNPESLPGFCDGLFFVQDKASLVSSLALMPKRGDVIVDVCSAPGGKAFSASIISGGAELYCFDLHESKLSLICSGVERLGLENITVEPRDALDPDERLIGRADRVICDVPCSGLGVLGKKADLRYKDLLGADELPKLQGQILRACARYLSEGGELVYSTCTLSPAENEEIVRQFLAENEDFSLQDFKVGSLASENGMLTLIPHIHKTDGFFMAKLKLGKKK